MRHDERAFDDYAIITRAAARVELRRRALGRAAEGWVPWDKAVADAEGLAPPTYPGSGLAPRQCLECARVFQSKGVGNRWCKRCAPKMEKLAAGLAQAKL